MGWRGLQVKIPTLSSNIKQAGGCKGEAEGIYTGGVLSLNSAGLLIITFRGSSPVWSATQVKITPQAKKNKTKTKKNGICHSSFVVCVP